VTATAAHLTVRAKQHNISFAHQSVATIGANRQADGLPVARNIPTVEPTWLSRGSPSPVAGTQPSDNGNSSSSRPQGPRKAKSLAVRWGQDSDLDHDSSSQGGGVPAPQSPGGYCTTPASPLDASAAAEAAAGVWDEAAWVAEHQQHQQYASAAGSAQHARSRSAGPFQQQQQQQQQQLSSQGGSSSRSQAGSFRSQGLQELGGSDSSFFLPEPSAQTWEGVGGGYSSDGVSAGPGRGSMHSSSGGGSAAVASGAGGDSAGVEAQLTGMSIGGNQGFSSRHSAGGAAMWEAQDRRSSAAAAAAAGGGASVSYRGEADELGMDESECTDTHSRDSGASQQQQQWGSAGGGSASSSSGRASGRASTGAGAPVIYSLLSELDLSENPLGLTGAKAVGQVNGHAGFPGRGELQ
jgi:hypothetical protein